ncbi:RNA-binding protein 47 isoform X2 [Leptinotarsa decemlineata]
MGHRHNFVQNSFNLVYNCEVMTMEGKRLITECIRFQKILYHPIKKTEFVPKNGSELFVKNIPFDAEEDELVDFFEKCGEIFQLRLMMADDGVLNRGFCYVSYMSPEEAKKAAKELKCTAFRSNVFLSIESSLNNCRIFIGGIPTFKTKDQIWQELEKNGVKNIVDVIMYRSYINRAENRGFVFVEFQTHEQAASFRVKYVDSLKLWGKPAIVDWSIPIPVPDTSVLESVKIIYLRNLEVTETPENLEGMLLQYVEKKCLEKVYKFKDYAFVHLSTREEAEKLMVLLKDHYKDTLVEIEWARPPSKYTSPEYRHQKICSFSKPRSRTCSSSSNLSQNSDECSSSRWSPKPLEQSAKSDKETQTCKVSQESPPILLNQLDIDNKQELRPETTDNFMCGIAYDSAARGLYRPLCQCNAHFITRCHAESPLRFGYHSTPPLFTVPNFSANDSSTLLAHRCTNSLPLPRNPDPVDCNYFASMRTSEEYDPIQEYQRRMSELYGEKPKTKMGTYFHD